MRPVIDLLLQRLSTIKYASRFGMLLLFTGIALSEKNIEAVEYFEVTEKVNLTQQVGDCADLVLTPNGGFALITAGLQNSTIQVYKISHVNGQPHLEGLVFQPTENTLQFNGLNAIGLSENGNYVYTVSGGLYNTTASHNQNQLNNVELDFARGTWITVLQLDQDQGHLSLPSASLFIADSSDHCELMTIGINRLYVTINNRLYSVNVSPMALGSNITLNVDDSAWVSSMAYAAETSKQSLYVGIGRNHKTDEESPAMVIPVLDEGTKFTIQDPLSFGSFSFQGIVTSVQVCRASKKPAQVFVLSSNHGNGVVWSINVANPSYKNNVDVNGDTATDIKTNKQSTRLFVSSRRATLAALKITAEYDLYKLEPAALDGGSHLKLALLPDENYILTLVKNDSQPDALILYRINEPEPSHTLLKATVATAGAITLAAVITISTWLTCRWLRNRGARLGYQPLSDY